MKAVLHLALVVFEIAVCISQDINNTLVTQYGQMICNNEPSCTLVTHFSIPEDERSLDKRDCMCDSECKEYTDCCYDSPYYKMSEQIQPQLYYCPPSINVYMKTNCPITWTDDFVARQCEKSMQPLDSEDIMLILPVTNRETRITYGNAYCAYCHNDRNFQPWLLIPSCTPTEPLPLPSQTTPAPPPMARVSPPVFYNSNPQAINVFIELNPVQSYMLGGPPVSVVLDIFLYQQTINGVHTISAAPVGLSMYTQNGYSRVTTRQRRKADTELSNSYQVPYDHAEVWRFAKFDEINKRFVSSYNNINFECQIGPKLPDNMRPLTRTCVPHVIDTCPADADPVQVHYCRESTSVVYNKYTKRTYRNKYCAYCNMELKAYLTGCVQKTEDTYFKSFQPSYGGLYGGVNPCSRPGAFKKLNCP